MERFLCLDIGDKRIGIAVSDPFNTYSLPVETYFRKNLKTDLAKIKEYVDEVEQIGKLLSQNKDLLTLLKDYGLSTIEKKNLLTSIFENKIIKCFDFL